jgi:serine protease Do
MKILVRMFFLPLLLSGVLLGSDLDRIEGDIKNLYSAVSPSIVSVHYGTNGETDFIGTGVVIDAKSHIVTIKRFVKDDTIWIETDTGEKIGAELVGSDSESGIAILRVGKSLKPAKVCSIKELNPGDFLFVIGNSFGLQNGISISIFSGKRDGNEYLQLGNAVLPGNSGAGVFNTNGELVGIVSFALNTSLFFGLPEMKSLLDKELKIKIAPDINLAESSGPGVVIPCEKMVELANEIIAYGKVERGWLGIFIKEEKGFISITGLVDDSPAEKAGLKEGDMILKYGDEDVEDLHSFIKTVIETKPGTKVPITVKRGDKEKKIDVKIGSKPDDETIYRFKEIIPSLKFFYEKEELEKMKEELEKLKEEIEEKEKNE